MFIHILVLKHSLCEFTVNGGWSIWNGWSTCSVSCGPGNRSRTRICTTPSNYSGDLNCEGPLKHFKSCNMFKCSGKFVEIVMVIMLYRCFLIFDDTE